MRALIRRVTVWRVFLVMGDAARFFFLSGENVLVWMDVVLGWVAVIQSNTRLLKMVVFLSSGVLLELLTDCRGRRHLAHTQQVKCVFFFGF